MKSPEGHAGPVIPATERRDLDLSPRAGSSTQPALAVTRPAGSFLRKPQRRELSYPLAALAYTWAALCRRGRV